METVSNLQLIIIISAIIIASFLCAIIFYKMGKKERDILNRGKLSVTKSKDLIESAKSSETKNDLQQSGIKAKVMTIEKKEHLNDDKVTKEKTAASNLYPKKVEEEINNDKNSAAENEKKESGSKFLKYTSSGYVQAKGDKNAGIIRWR
jgi:hypothetical protein